MGAPGVGVGAVVLGGREGSGEDGQEEAEGQNREAETSHFGLFLFLFRRKCYELYSKSGQAYSQVDKEWFV